MKITTSWRRLEPDTIGGEKLKVEIIYSSNRKSEIDDLEKQMVEKWGRGIIVMDTEADRNDA